MSRDALLVVGAWTVGAFAGLVLLGLGLVAYERRSW